MCVRSIGERKPGMDYGFYLFRDVFFPLALLNGLLGPFVFRLLEGLEKYDRPKFD